MSDDSEICQPFSIISISHLCSFPLGPHTKLHQKLQSLRFWVHLGTFKIIRSNQGCASQERPRWFLHPFSHQILDGYIILKNKGAQLHQAPWSFSPCPKAHSTHTLLRKSCGSPLLTLTQARSFLLLWVGLTLRHCRQGLTHLPLGFVWLSLCVWDLTYTRAHPQVGTWIRLFGWGLQSSSTPS